MNRLKNKVAVITGASSGVGKTAAFMMAAEGAKVVLAARRETILQEIADEIRANGGEAAVVKTDVSNSSDVKNLIKKAVEIYGGLDILVNAAGIIEKGLPSIDKVRDEDISNIISTNTNSVLYTMREASKVMLEAKKGGSIINVASVAGIVGNGGAAYVASKGAIIGVSRHAALRLNRDNIRVNAICPGSIATPMTLSAREAPDQDLINQLMKHSDIMRQPMVLSPEQVAGLIVYLASDEAAPITGQSIVMDYGVTL